jgi:hypothetical protein
MLPKEFDLGDTLFRYASAGNLFDKILMLCDLETKLL